MTRFIHRIGLFVLAALFLAPVAMAQDQQQPPQQPPAQQPAPDVEVSEGELETIADMLLEVEALQLSYQPKVEQAESQEEAQELQMEFQQEVTEKIEANEDITPERFDEIMRAAQADEELREEITAAVENAREDGGNGQ